MTRAAASGRLKRGPFFLVEWAAYSPVEGAS